MSLSLNVPILTAKNFYTGYKFTKYQCHCPRPSRSTSSRPSRPIDLRLAKILKTKLCKRALKYTHFEPKGIVIQENKFPRLT